MSLLRLVEQSGMTKAYIAERLGYTRPHFSAICHGHTPLKLNDIGRLAEIMRLPVETVTAAVVPGMGEKDGQTSESERQGRGSERAGG